MSNRWKLVAGALLLALALAACGGDDGGGGTTAATGTTATTGTTGETGVAGGTVAPEEYVSSVCTSMQTFVDDVTTMSNDFGSTLDPTADVQTQKDAIVGLFDDMLASMDGLISELQAAGTPDVENGEQITAALSTSFSDARQALQDARDQVEGLAVDDPTAFATELTNIGTAIQESMSGITGSLNELDAPELSEAASNEPACASLAGSGVSGTT